MRAGAADASAFILFSIFHEECLHGRDSFLIFAVNNNIYGRQRPYFATPEGIA